MPHVYEILHTLFSLDCIPGAVPLQIYEINDIFRKIYVLYGRRKRSVFVLLLSDRSAILEKRASALTKETSKECRIAMKTIYWWHEMGDFPPDEDKNAPDPLQVILAYFHESG